MPIKSVFNYLISMGLKVSIFTTALVCNTCHKRLYLIFNQVAWIKADTKAILAIHEHVITNNQRLSVTHNDFNTWTLNIRGVKREDRGQYMCQVNTDPMKMQVSRICITVKIVLI